MGTTKFHNQSGRGIDFQSAAKALSVILPIIGVAGVVIPYVFGFTSLSILAVYIAIPCVIAPILYFYTTDIENTSTDHAQYHTKLLVSVFLLLQAVTVVLLYTNTVRPYSYFAAVVGLAFVILIQILQASNENPRSGIILTQIALLHLNLIWGVTIKYNYHFGRTDTFGHVHGVRLITEHGHITPAFSGNYQSFPLWHILGSMEHLLLGGQVAPRTTVFIISGIIYAIVPIGVFLIAKRIFSSQRVALAAALLTCLNATVIDSGMYSIPRSAAAFLFVLILVSWVRNDDRSIGLFALFVLAIAAYHTVSLPFVFIILLVDYFSRQVAVPLLSAGPTVRPARRSHLLLGLIVLVQAGYWLFFADYLLEHLVSVVFGQGTPGAVNTGVVEQPLREVANYLHHSTLLVFVFVGTLLGLSSDRVSAVTKSTLLTALILVGISFPGPHLLVRSVAESFNVLRFSVYTFPFISMGAAYGLVSILGQLKPHKNTAKVLVLVALFIFLLFSFTTISNDFVAGDNPAVERQFYTSYLSEAEEQSMQTVAGIGAGSVASDYAATRYYESSEYAEKSRIMGVSENAEQLHFGDDSDILLVREGELETRSLQVWATDNYVQDGSYHGELRYVGQDDRVWLDLNAGHQVYDSGVVSGHQQTRLSIDQ